jgi:hypothetical protein
MVLGVNRISVYVKRSDSPVKKTDGSNRSSFTQGAGPGFKKIQKAKKS